MYNQNRIVIIMEMATIYYIILGVSIVSYLVGLFLAHFEKKGKIAVLSHMGNAGFVNVYGVNQPVPEELFPRRW